MSTIETLERDILDMKSQVLQLQQDIVAEKNERFELELEFTEMKGDVKYVKQSVEKMNANMTKLMFIIIAGVASGIFAVLFTG